MNQTEVELKPKLDTANMPHRADQNTFSSLNLRNEKRRRFSANAYRESTAKSLKPEQSHFPATRVGTRFRSKKANKSQTRRAKIVSDSCVP